MNPNEFPYQSKSMQPISRNRLLEKLYANDDDKHADRTTPITMTLDEIIQHHIDALGLPDQRLVSRATNQLVQIGEPAVYALINVLRHENRLVAIQAKAALHGIGEPAIHPLINALNDAHLRMVAKTVLATFGDSAMLPLLEALYNADQSLAIAICSTFGLMGPSAMQVLSEAIDSAETVFQTKLIDCIEIAHRAAIKS